MQHSDEARPGAKMLGIGPDGQHGLRRSVEQQIVDNGLVLVGDIRDCPRQGEDLMEVLHRQQFSLAGGKPLPRRRALALRTVAVGTTIIRDGHVPAGAVLAARDMAAESRRAAVLDGAHDLELAKTYVTAIGLAPSGPVATENIRNLQRWAGHRSLRLSPPLPGVSGLGSESRSSGLVTVCRMLVATWA